MKVSRMSRWLPLLWCLICLPTLSRADSITIGQLQYLGTEDGVSGFKVTINTTGVTLQPLAFESAALSVKSGFQSAGPITSPSVILFTGGVGRPLPACPCSSVLLQLSFLSPNQQITFVLADGTTFTTRSTLHFNLHATRGRLNAGDVIPIRLTAVPEPGTLLLVGGGFLLAGRKIARPPKRLAVTDKHDANG